MLEKSVNEAFKEVLLPTCRVSSPLGQTHSPSQDFLQAGHRQELPVVAQLGLGRLQVGVYNFVQS